jgi:hypothetical protein
LQVLIHERNDSMTDLNERIARIETWLGGMGVSLAEPAPAPAAEDASAEVEPPAEPTIEERVALLEQAARGNGYML